MIPFRSIRIRLTAWYSAVLLAGLLLFGLFLWLAARHYLLVEVDERLAQGIRGLRAVIEQEIDQPDFLDELREYARAAPGGALLRVREENGAELLAPARRRNDRRYRAATGRVSIHGRTFELESGAALGDIDRTLAQFRTLLLILIPFMVAIAFGGGYWISGRALAPVDELTEAARRISLENLSERLPVRPTGDELERLADTWNQMLARLEASVRRITAFTADASHELRTPVSVIMTTAELALRRERGAAEYRQALAGIVAEARRMTGLTDDLLALARADSSQAPLPFEPVDLNELARDAAAQMAALAQSRGIRLATEGTRAALPLRANRPALRRLLLILLDNALKHTPPGGSVVVSVSDGPTLAVRDTGEGIAPEDLPHVFDRFYRADKSRTGANGVGLGLSIAQAIARMHGARIEVESARGAGSRFFVVLSSNLQKKAID